MDDVVARHRRARVAERRWVGLEALEPRILLSAYVVDSLADDGGGAATTLREAIDAANAAGGADTITFESTLFSGGPDTITLGGSQLSIADDLTIIGPAPDLLAIDANNSSRVFLISTGVVASLSGLTITGGYAQSTYGGGIHARQGTLTLTNIVVADNFASADGGGIYSEEGSVSLANVTVAGNSAAAGGGIHARSGSTLTIVNSTISGNTAKRYGGGMYLTHNETTTALTNVTITGNRADSDGNDDGQGGGIYSQNGDHNLLHNTIVAGNFRGTGATNDDVGRYIDQASSYNLIGAIDGGWYADGTGTIYGTSAEPLDAMLGPLGDNGGSIPTHRLLPASVAIDVGSNDQANDAGLTTDQRGAGFARILGSTVDIGAVEGTGANASIGDLVWHDGNGDGLQDAGENGIDGLTVRLCADDGDSVFEPGGDDILVGVRTTVGGGGYAFLGMYPGDYWIDIDESTPLLNGFVVTGGSNPRLVTLAAEEDYNNVDFGYYVPRVVSTLLDENNGDYAYGDLSLRETIELANNSLGPDVIQFDPVLFASGPGTITLDAGQLMIADELTIVGPGSNLLTIDANNTGARIFEIGRNVTAFLSGLTATGGAVGVYTGGGIYNRGNLTLDDVAVLGNSAKSGGGIGNSYASLTLRNSTVSGNSASLDIGGYGGGIYSYSSPILATNTAISGNAAQQGGGIFAQGNLTLDKCTIYNNTASVAAGGIFAGSASTITRSTISGNTAIAKSGGGIYATMSLTIINSTISDNSAGEYGGGVRGGDTTVVNTTITNNVADSDGDGTYRGGGISWDGSTITLHNTIVAGNTHGIGREDNDVLGTFAPASSYNLIGVIDGSTNLDGEGTLFGSTGTSPLDPMFEPLDNYGGPTLTFALMPGSPAVNAGNNDRANDAGLTTDQRGEGFPRILGTSVDIGAFERRDGDGSIGNRLWNDRNDNGIQDVGEEGINGISITLYLDDGDAVFEGGGDDVLFGVRTTVGDGAYGFLGLGAGGYWVDVDQDAAPLSGFMLTTETEPLLTTVAGGQDFDDVDLGYYRPIIVDVANDEAVDTDGQTSFREALALAEADVGYNIIQFDPALPGPTISLTAALGQLLINSDMEIRGTGRDELVVDSGTNSRAFYVGRGVLAVVSDLTVTGGQANRGGGIYVDEAAVVSLSGVTVTGNAASVNGGGIFADLDSSLAMVDCLIRDNEAVNQGGGIYAGGTLTLTRSAVIANSAVSDLAGRGKGGGIYVNGVLDAVNTTISRNESSFRGGGLYADTGMMLLTNVTVSGNLADSSQSGAGSGGGIYNDFPVMTLHNTIVAGNTLGGGTPDDVSGAFQAASSSNLIGTGDGSSGLANGVNGNQVGSDAAVIDARLMPLGDYGGAAQTYALRVDSPAIDAGNDTGANNAGLATDQRGLGRFVDHDGDASATVDIGAYEAAVPILVDGTLDEAADTDGLVSLREAIALAAATPGFDVVRFDSSLAPGGAGTLVLTLGQLVVDSDVDVQGFDTEQLTIDANANGRVFRVNAGVQAWISNLTVTGGAAADGGGIYNVGALSLSGVTLSGNSATQHGGAIDNIGTLTAVNSTISGNVADEHGGGLYSDGTTSLTNVTIIDNTGDNDDGGGGSGGGVYVASGDAVVHNTVIAANFRGSAAPVDDDAAGVFDASGSYNVIGVIDGSSGLSVGLGSQYGTTESPKDPMLGGLADNGGPTETHAIGAGSPVIDAGSNARADDAGLTGDQRGEDRFKDALDDGVVRVDIGAFEQQFRLNIAPTLTAVDTLGGAVEDQDFVIDYGLLFAAGDAADIDGDPISFRIESVSIGDLKLDSVPVTPGVTLLEPGGSLTWTPPDDLTGEVAAVFSVRAWDGWAHSTLPPLDVAIEIAATADPVNYAVLFSGGVSPERNYLRYYDNIREMYQVLVNSYGLKPHNIYVLYADGSDPGIDRSDGQNSDMSFAPNVLSADSENLTSTLSLMASSIDANDHFMFWTFDHGVGSSNPTENDEEVLNGWGELIEDQNIAAWLAPIDTGYRSYIFNQCFSGGILDNLAIAPGTNRFGAASSTHYEVSYGDAFVGAFTEALQAGYRYTHDAYRYALTHDHYATAGEGPGGDRVSGVEHPWSLGDNFPIFAMTESSNGNPTLTEILPLKIEPGDYDLEITYDMLIAAGDAIDPDGDAIVFRIESVDIGTMTHGGIPVVEGVTELRYDESVVWTSLVNPSGMLNAFTLVVMDGVAPAGGAVLAQISVGPPGSVEAVDDSVTIQQNSADIYVDVLANDTIGAGGAVHSVGVATHGTVELVGGQVRYTPAEDFSGFDTFHYAIEDSSGSTDIAAVSISVVDYDPTTVNGSFGYEVIELSAPRGWLGLPEEWGAAYLNALPDWTSSYGLDIREDGYALIGIAREDLGDDALWYRGGNRASYLWHPDLDTPDWADLVEVDGVVTSSNNIDVLMYETDIPVPDDPDRNIVYGVEATSIDHSDRIAGIVFRDPDNAFEPYLVGAIVEGVGPSELWHELEEEEILPRDISVSGVLIGDYDGFDGEHATIQVFNAATGTYEIDATLYGFGGDEQSSGQAINKDGHVVGSAEYDNTAGVLYQAFLYDGGQMIAIDLPAGDTQSRAFGINANDQVVGASDVAPFVFNSSEAEDPHGHAFFWDSQVNGDAVPLEALPGYQYSVAYDINDNGVIVGLSANLFGDSRACIWVPDEAGLYGEVMDLNAEAGASGYALTAAHAINNKNQIIATGEVDGTGEVRAYYLDVIHTGVDAEDDYYNVDETGALTIPNPGLLANDTDAVSIENVDTDTYATRGRVTWSAYGGFTYEYNPDLNPDYDLNFGDEPFVDRFSYIALDSYDGQDTALVTITVNPVSDTLYVTNFQPIDVGFDVTFSRGINTDILNLYDGQDAPADAADITLSGLAGGEVRGSALWDPAGQTLSFIATGGPLAADSYTVALTSAADGLADEEGSLLDGDHNGLPGGDYTTGFTVGASSARVVSIPDFARGPDQAVNIPATAAGLPISIDDADGLRAVNFTIEYDPTLLDVTGVSLAEGMPGDWSINHAITPGEVVVTMWTSQPAGLPPGAGELAVLAASVPLDAPYGSAGALRLTSLSLNGGDIEVIPDDAVYKTAYVGDATGNHTYSSMDASLISRVVVGLDSGFDAYDLTDPFILANVHDNGVLDGMDISFIHAKAVDLVQDEVPDLPDTLPPGAVSGPDPVVTVPSGTEMSAGDSTAVILTVDDTAGLQAFDFTLNYDTTLLDVGNIDIALGGLVSGGWSLTPNVNDATGLITVGAFRDTPMSSLGGEILQITFHAPPGVDGASNLDLEGQLNEGALALTPVDGGIDVIDPDGPVTVKSVTTNSSQAQRSRIDSIAITLRGSATLSADALSLHNDSTDEDFPLDQVPFDEASNTWDISPVALTDGRYTATLSAVGVEVHEFEFHVLLCDTDGDGDVGATDYGTFVSQFGRSGNDLAADFNNSGRVDLRDFAIMRACFGNTLPPLAPPAAPEAPLAAPPATLQAAVEPDVDILAASAVADDEAPAVGGDLLGIEAPVLPFPGGRSIATPGYEATDHTATTLYRTAMGEYDLQPLDDDPAAGEADDLLTDILAESPLAVLL